MSTSEYVNKKYSNMTWKSKPSSRCEYVFGKITESYAASRGFLSLSRKGLVLFDSVYATANVSSRSQPAGVPTELLLQDPLLYSGVRVL